MSSESSVLPAVACLKVYDRRYLAERQEKPNGRLFWTWQREQEATAEPFVESDEDGDDDDDEEDDDDDDDIPFGLTEDEGNAEWEQQLADMGGLEPNEITSLDMEFWTADENNPMPQGRLEERYRQRMNKYFTRECESYKRLASAQGDWVPKFYGSVSFDSKTLSDMPPGILADEVKGILLEFIDGTSIEAAKPIPLLRKFPNVTKDAVSCILRISTMGLMQRDVSASHFIVRNSDGKVLEKCFLSTLAMQSFEGPSSLISTG
jgi:hypothetical protein